MKKTLLTIFTICAVNFSFAQSDVAEYGKINRTGTFKEYLSKNGDHIKVGDSLQIGIATGPYAFTYISQGEEGNMHPTHSGKKVKISKIHSSGRKNSGYKIFFNFKGFGLLPVTVDYETALEVGEIKLVNANMTKSEAIDKLKQQKELLDLEIISQEQYNKIKEELTPIITK